MDASASGWYSVDIGAFGWHATIFPSGLLLLLAAAVLVGFGLWKVVRLLRAIS